MNMVSRITKCRGNMAPWVTEKAESVLEWDSRGSQNEIIMYVLLSKNVDWDFPE
jgi:hypothetical protein